MFKPGDMVSHALHGVGVLKSYQDREVAGAPTLFATLVFHGEGFEVTLPKSVLDRRVRALMDESQALRIVTVLANGSEPLETAWKKRHQENQDRLTSGNPLELCAVIKSLTDLRRKRPLANSDKEQLRHCLHRLAEEICAVLGGEHAQTVARLEQACVARK